ncbi:flagellar basal body rod protein FlgC [Lyticum sinuosum]|uniref:Flagellar basal-body rod protein FlgC n=1 Tax=Lyticum sinuosum TaxID=1332059 RepID=A0AAE5AHM9_9RICK|nr:flagellar basal body rod protein FlgC [Lyticum sinuosum]MDZ5760879.1 Flagellar basal-body rod protein FlgC [Lyticum sinuosum]
MFQPLEAKNHYYITDSRDINDDSITASIKIAESGMQAQSNRLKVISQNIANSEVTGTDSSDNPYRRKIIFFKNVIDQNTGAEIIVVDKIDIDKSPYILKYEPHHPAADQNGYVKYPNVNIIIENVDAKEAERSFSANINSLGISKSLAHKTLKIME